MKLRTKNFGVPRFVHFSRVVNTLIVVLGVSWAIGVPLPGIAGTDIYEYTDANGVLTLTNAGAQRSTTVGPGESDQTVRSIRLARPLTANLYQQHVEQAARVHAIDPA